MTANKALLALHGKEIFDAALTKKVDVAAAYRRAVADEWSDLVEFAVETARAHWRYAIPRAAADRKMLRANVERTLGCPMSERCRQFSGHRWLL